MPRLRWWLFAPLFVLPLVGCDGAEEPPPSETELIADESEQLDHLHGEQVVLADGPDFVGEPVRYERDEPFRQVGFHYGTSTDEPLEWRARHTDGSWSDWKPVEVTWREDGIHVARAFPEEDALDLELRGDDGLREVKVQFYERIVARTDRLTRDLPKVGESESDDDVATTRQAVAPDSMVKTRHEWGARNPDKECGSPHDPYRMSIHHSYSPSSDGGDPDAAVRSMQAYHIDNNGWCDLGYHFVASQSGQLYQGRLDETRIGAHVGGENTGNVGICMIGDFTSQQVSDTQLNATAEMVGRVHETYGVSLDRDSVRGHREWPGQSTSCPGDNALNRIDDIIDRAANGGTQRDYSVDVRVRWHDSANFYKQGASHNVADALPDDTVVANLYITNTSDHVMRDVWLGYRFAEPWLEATDYTIFTDHPEYDEESWTVNDADEADENPAKDALGDGGRLNLYALSPGETKRIRVHFDARRYNVGANERPEVRAWLRDADDEDDARTFGPKTSFDETPDTNEVEGSKRGQRRIDVLDRNAWLFEDTTDEGNLEGWEGSPEDHFDELKNNTNHAAMAMRVTDSDPRLISPEWTRVPTDEFDELVLRARAHDGHHTKKIFWARDDEDFSPERSVSFEVPGDGEFVDLVVPIGEHKEWSGNVDRLRIDPIDGEAPGEDDSGWYDFEHVFFQDSADETTSLPGGEYVDETPVELDTDENEGDDDSDDPSDDDPSEDDSSDDDTSGDETDDGEADGEQTTVNEGCAASGSSAPGSGGFALLVVVLVAARLSRAERGG
ncbi:MAG: peptidoglycan recognition family protein [Persicimonas sp.]